MTLIVGRVLDGAVRIVADSQISYGTETRFSTPFRGTLKVLAVSAQTAIAYSSSHVDYALKAIRDAIADTGKDLHTVDAGELARALRDHTATDDHEFLVASMTSMHVVRSNTVTRDQQVASMGDHKAFAEYQRLYLEGQASAAQHAEARAAAGFAPSDSVRSGMADALGGVMADERFPSVGGLSVTLAADNSRCDGFRYLPYSRGFDFNFVVSSGRPQSVLHSKSVAQGGYYYSLLVPAAAGVPAIAVHVVQGRMGAFFHPLKHDDPVVVPDVDAAQFMDTVRRDHGVELTGMAWK